MDYSGCDDDDKPGRIVSPKAKAFVDALVSADNPGLWSIALAALPALSRDDALAAITWRASQLSPEEGDALHRLSVVQKALELAKPIAPAASLPPFEAYRRAAAGELTPTQVGDIWRARLADQSWDADWIRSLNAYIEASSSPEGDKELVTFARAQVEAARVIGNLELVAMTLTTLGGVTIQIEQRVAEGLGFELEALESLIGADQPLLDNYLRLVCMNLFQVLRAVSDYDGVEEVLPLVQRMLDVVAPAAARSLDPGAAAVAYQALSLGIDEVSLTGADCVEDLAVRAATIHWPELQVGDGVIQAALLLAKHLPLRSVESTLALAQAVGDSRGDSLFTLQLRLQAAQTVLNKALTEGGQARDDEALEAARVWADRLAGWLRDCGQDVPARDMSIALILWAKARAAAEPGDLLVGERLERALALLSEVKEAPIYRDAVELLGRWLGWHARIDRAKELFLPLTVKLSLDESIDTSEVDAKAAGLSQYAVVRRCSRDHDSQAVAREIIPLLEAACRGAWEPEVKIRCGAQLLAVRMFANFTDNDEKTENTWGIITLLTDVFGQPPAESDSYALAEYWDLTAEGWGFFADASDALKSQALGRMTDAAKAFDQLGEPLKAAGLWIRLAQETAVQDLCRAAEFLERARPAVESAGDLSFCKGDFDNVLGRLAAIRGDNDGALAAYRRAAELFKRLPLENLQWTAKLPLGNRARLLMDLNRWPEAYEDLSMAIALEERHISELPTIPRGSQMTSFESTGAVLSSFTQPLYSNMALTCLRLQRATESFGWSERARAGNLRRQIAFRSVNRNERSEPCDLEKLRVTLGNDQEWVFVQYLVRDSETLAYVVSNDSIDVVELRSANNAIAELARLELELNGQRCSLSEIVESLRTAPTDKATLTRWDRALIELGERMFAILLEPIMDRIRSSARTLVLSGNGGLERLPWNLAAWREGTQTVHIIDRYAVRKAISASVMRLMASGRPRQLSGLVVSGTKNSLPFTALEATQVETTMRGWLGNAAALIDVVPTTLIAATAGRSHIHLACHGDFNRLNPLQTRLILSAGQPAVTIPIADIVKARLENGCVVVLSACETGMLHHDAGGEHLGLPAAL